FSILSAPAIRGRGRHRRLILVGLGRKYQVSVAFSQLISSNMARVSNSDRESLSLSVLRFTAPTRADSFRMDRRAVGEDCFNRLAAPTANVGNSIATRRLLGTPSNGLRVAGSRS